MAKSTRGSSSAESRAHNPGVAGSTPAPATAKAKTSADWDAVERDYRAGLLSVREIAASHGLSHTAINKRAKAHSWARDLQAKILAKADELVSRREVSDTVSKEALATERQIIEANAERIAQVRGEHRADIGRARTLVLSLLGELEAETGDLETFRSLGEMMAKPDEKGVDKLNEAYHKAISMPQRVSSVKALTEALKNLVALEREAYGIAAANQPTDPPPADALPLNEAARRMAYILSAGLQKAGQ